jgi:hypothetical protein
MPREERSPGALQCWTLDAPEHIRKRWYPNVRPHPATELVALRTGSHTARVCKRCAESELGHSYPGGQWWTRADAKLEKFDDAWR